PAHSPRHPDWYPARGRALHHGRAQYRPAPARQRAPNQSLAAPARHRQLGDCGGARQGHDTARRPRARHWPRRGHPRRPHRGRGYAGCYL
nr:hypothetical protein [Tanacetum cinerariifolium]